jgi:DNA polymerase-3 subunit gamma/tau
VLAALKQRSIVVWANVSTNAQVVGIEGNLVTLGFGQVGAMKNFTGGGKDAVVASALGDVLGGTWRVEAVVGGSPVSQGFAGSRPGPQSGPQPGSNAGSHAGPQSGSHTGPHPGSHAGPQTDPSQSSVSRYNQPGAAAAPQSGAQSGHGRAHSHGSSNDDSGSQEAGQPPGPADHASQSGVRPTTDESWPDAPDDPSPGSPPTPDPTESTTGVRPQGAGRAVSVGAGTGSPGAGLVAARSAAKAAAQAGPRAPGSRQQAGSAAWPEAVPNRRKGPEADEVDPLNDADADVDARSGMALLQSELGAQVIGEI